MRTPFWKFRIGWIRASWNWIKITFDLLLIHSTFRKDPAFAPLSFGTEIIALSKSAKNIGVTIGSTMSFSIRIGLICKSSFVHDRNIARIPKYVPFKTIATLIHDFVTPKIDYCNSVLYGYPIMNSEITTGSQWGCSCSEGHRRSYQCRAGESALFINWETCYIEIIIIIIIPLFLWVPGLLSPLALLWFSSPTSAFFFLIQGFYTVTFTRIFC